MSTYIALPKLYKRICSFCSLMAVLMISTQASAQTAVLWTSSDDARNASLQAVMKFRSSHDPADLTGALEAANQAIALSKGSTDRDLAYSQRALVKRELKNFAGACDDYTFIIKQQDFMAGSAYYGRGISESMEGQVDAAKADLDVAVAMLGNNPLPGNYVVFATRGKFRREQGDLVGADADETMAASLKARVGAPAGNNSVDAPAMLRLSAGDRLSDNMKVDIGVAVSNSVFQYAGRYFVRLDPGVLVELNDPTLEVQPSAALSVADKLNGLVEARFLVLHCAACRLATGRGWSAWSSPGPSGGLVFGTYEQEEHLIRLNVNNLNTPNGLAWNSVWQFFMQPGGWGNSQVRYPSNSPEQFWKLSVGDIQKVDGGQ